MKLISWNVNGFRSVLTKGFENIFNTFDSDFFCIQETKMKENQADFNPAGYFSYLFSAEKAGYSGTGIFAKKEPLSVSYGIEGKHTNEGRVITLEYEGFYLVCAYVPNAQRELKRLDYRMEWEDAFLAYLKDLDSKKPVILCGDLEYQKPHASTFEAICEAMGCAPGEALYVGDNPVNDVEGARRAGMVPVWMRSVGLWFDALEPSPYAIDAIGELPELIEKINGGIM